METNQQPAQPKMIQALLTAPNLQIKSYLKILEEYNRVVYYTADQFIQYIFEQVGEEKSQQFVSKFRQDHQNSSNNFCFHYPVVKDKDKVFENKKLIRFINEYVREESKIQQGKEQKKQEEQLNQQIQKKKAEQMKKEKQNQPVVRQIPSVLLNREKTLSFLLQLNLTQSFQNQLEQVKGLIRQQIIDGYIVLKTYRQFLRQFLETYYIKQGLCENGFIDNCQQIKRDLSQYFRYYQRRDLKIKQAIEENVLSRCWKQISLQLNRLMKKNVQEIFLFVKSTLLQSLNSIYLTFSFLSKINGNYINRSIFININQMNCFLELKSFRQGPLKPYIALTIYHQISNWLIRENSFSKFNSYGSLASSSIGNMIIQFMNQQYYSVIPSYLLLEPKPISSKKKEESSFPIKNIVEKAKQLLSKHWKLFSILKDIKNLQTIISTVKLFYNFGMMATEIDVSNYKDLWSSVYDYIDQLQKVDLQHNQNYQSQIEYRLFFSFFLSKNIARNWLSLQEQEQQKYELYRQKLCKIKLTSLFIKKNQFIDKTMDLIKEQLNGKQFYSNPDVQNYTNYILFKECTFENLNQRIEQIDKCFQTIDQQEKHQLIHQFNSTLQNYQYFFKKLKADHFYKNFIHIYIEQILTEECSEKLSQIFYIQQVYEILKNIVAFSDILLVAYQLPSFFTNAGQQIQKRFFPNIRIQQIYAKDYNLMKQIEFKGNRIQVGKRPQKLAERIQSIYIGAENYKKDSGEKLKGGICGNYLWNFRHDQHTKDNWSIRDKKTFK